MYGTFSSIDVITELFLVINNFFFIDCRKLWPDRLSEKAGEDFDAMSLKLALGQLITDKIFVNFVLLFLLSFIFINLV